MHLFNSKNWYGKSKISRFMLFTSIMITLVSCGETRVSNPFATPRPGESGVLAPGNGATFERREKVATLLLIKPDKSASHGRLVSVGFESSQGQSTKLDLPADNSNSLSPACYDGNRNIEIFILENPDLIPICDSAAAKSLSSSTIVSLNYLDGKSRIMTTVSSSRAMIDNFEVVVTHLDH
jgi:hypothetical protein